LSGREDEHGRAVIVQVVKALYGKPNQGLPAVVAGLKLI
jgi:hypothetical protein